MSEPKRKRRTPNYATIDGLQSKLDAERRARNTLKRWAMYSFVLGGIAAFGAGLIVGLNV